MTALHDMDATMLGAVLSSTPGWPWPGQPLRLKPIVGGITNVNWQLQVGADPRRYFVKVPGDGASRFVDRGVANEALTASARLGLSPTPLFYDPETTIEVTEFLEGYVSASEYLLTSPENAIEVVRIYRRLHTSPLLSHTSTVFDLIDEHGEQIRELGVRLSPWVHTILDRWKPAQDAFLSSGVELVPCHNDVYWLNFMVKPGASMKLIDFDYAANNERAFEIGSFTQVYMVSDHVRRDMIEELYGQFAPVYDGRVGIAGLACDMKWALWSEINAATVESDMDFGKFALTKWVNAENTMRSPRFARWVRSL